MKILVMVNLEKRGAQLA